MVLIASFLPGASYATTGTVSIASASYIIPVSAINTAISATGVLGTGDSAERLIYGLNEALYQKVQAGTYTQPTLGIECSNKTIQRAVWEATAGTFANTNLVSHLISTNVTGTVIHEDPSNISAI